jgi:centromere/kinetochore protein ZW10
MMNLDDPMVPNTNTSRSALQDRLNKVRKAVHKATQEAWKDANGQLPSQSLQKENASFLLGMDLFGNTSVTGGDGDGTTVTSVLEQNVREKLDELERDLERLQLETALSSSSPGVHIDMESDENKDNEEIQETELSHQIEACKAKIAFLKQASFTRSCVEESTILASTALNPTNETDLVQASQKLLQALDEVDAAERVLSDSSSQSANEVAVGRQIISKLRHHIRKQRVELVHKASSVLDASFEMSESSIAIKSSEHLETAYQVLEILSGFGISDRTKSNVLEESMRNLSMIMYQNVFKPILETADKQANVNGASSLCIWNVEESSNKRAAMIGVSTAANKKGRVHRIEWRLITDNKGGDGRNATSSISEYTEESSFVSVNNWKNMLDVMQKVLVFVQSKVLLERESLCTLVGKKLFGRPTALSGAPHLNLLGLESPLLGENDQGVLMEGMVKWVQDHCLKEALLFDDVTQVSVMHEHLVNSTVPACRELVRRSLIPHEPEPKIVSFSKDFEKAYVEHRRCILLNQARDVLCDNDYHNTVIVGEEENPIPQDLKEEALAVFQLPRCSVSDTSHKIMALVRKTMDDAVGVSTDIAPDSVLSLLRPTLYRTAREMLTLFRSIIPSSHGFEIANVPRTAAVLHNDAVFLAHHCLTLGLEYREKFPLVDENDARGKLLKQTCIFVDMVPLFRELADTSLGDMMELQKRQLAEIVGSRISLFGKALRSDESLQEWSEAETALAAGIYHLRHLTQAWKPILSSSVFLRAMGYLADVLFALYVNQMLGATDISRTAGQFASALFYKATSDIVQVMGGEKYASKYVMEWGHFQCVGKFLGMNNLAQVEQALSSGVFSHLESQELSGLVQAAFDDTPHRQSLLNSISLQM